MAASLVSQNSPQVILQDIIGNSDIAERDFNVFRKMIYDEAGISLSEAKRTLVCSRLSKRLRHLRLKTYSEYLNYLANRDPQGTERQIMINCLTTNKTDFFREPHHFDFLRQQVFPQIEQDALNGGPRQLRIWSAACSSGEEPYSIAITVLEHFQSLRGWDVEIVASDINTEVLKKAKEGIYTLDRIEGVDLALKRKYFLRGKGKMEGSCQVAPELRNLINFRQVNFMDTRWPVEGRFDVIFCRNVLIYFNTETQQKLLPRLTEKIHNGGYLMLGHSENLPWLAASLTPLGQTIHHKAAQDEWPTGGSNRGQVSKVATSLPSEHVASAAVKHSSAKLVSGAAPTHRIRKSQELFAKPKASSKKEIVAGGFYATRDATEIATTLGSCVAACLFDPVAKIGGMNHFMLPFHASDSAVCGRYGVHAMELLINEIARLGGDRRRLRAKVFGGSSVINLTGASMNVGKCNADFVRKFLADESIPIDGQLLEVTEPLRVHFLPASGTAYVKPIQRTMAVLEGEKRFSQRLSEMLKKPSDNQVELF